MTSAWSLLVSLVQAIIEHGVKIPGASIHLRQHDVTEACQACTLDARVRLLLLAPISVILNNTVKCRSGLTCRPQSGADNLNVMAAGSNPV